MVKPKSTDREEYEYSYRMLRLQGEDMLHDFPPFPGSDAEECALLSYDSYDSEFSGWINRQRRARFFFKKLSGVFPERFPF